MRKSVHKVGVHEVFRDNGDEWLGLKLCKSVAGIEVRRLT